MVAESTLIMLAKKAAVVGGVASVSVLAVQEAIRPAVPFPSGMSVAEIAAWGAVGSLLIGAFFAGLNQVITSWRTMVTKITAIDAHVNSEKTSDTKTIEFQARENQLLRDQIADRDRIAGLLAQAEIQRGRQSSVASPTVVPEAVQSLDRIDTNTSETAKNTARVEATVQDLKDKA